LFALDNFEPNPSISSVTRFINGINNWFYADFSLSYDPCSYYFDSSLRIEAELLSNADIFLSGKLSGEIASINNNNSGNGVSHDGFASRLTTSAKTAQKAYKNVQGWVSDQVKQSLVNAPGASQSLQINFSDVYSTSVNVIQNHIVNDLATPEAISYIQNTHAENTQNIGFLQNLLNSSTFLKSGLKAVPFVGAALQFVNAFVSGGRKGSSTQTVQVMPMAINADLELGGTLSISKLYKGISFVTPGSLNSACSPDGFYPYYNEVLGVLNLLRTPEIRFRHQYFLTEDIDEFGPYFRERSYWQVQLTNLQYVLNPAARLRSDNIEILGSLQFKYTANGEVAYATSFVPIQTLLNAQVEFGTDVEQGPFSSFNEILGCFHDFPPIVELKLIFNLTRLDTDYATQNVLWVGTFPTNVINTPFFQFSNTKICDVPKRVTIANNTFVPSNTTIRAWEKINIGNNVQFGSGQPITIIAPEIHAPASLPSNVVLQFDYPGNGSLYHAPITNQTSIMNFCNSASYNPTLRALLRTESENHESPKVRTESIEYFNIFPNPVTDQSTVSFKLIEPGLVSFILYDMAGRIFQQIAEQNYEAGHHEVAMPLGSLPNGMYLLKLQGGNGSKTLRLTVNK
jgi:hypothetical protein